MSRHLPTTSIEVDVFDDDGQAEVDVTDAAAVAWKAWNTIRRWIEEGYEPVLDVTLPDGTLHTIDLELEENRR